MKVDPTGKTSKLAAQVILEARKGLKKPEYMVEVALWFTGRDFPFWAEVANVPFADPLVVFREMKPHNARVLLSRLRNLRYSDIPDGYTLRDVLETKKRVVPVLSEIINHGRAAKGTNKTHGTQTRITQ